jgi:hypothetical protein
MQRGADPRCTKSMSNQPPGDGWFPSGKKVSAVKTVLEWTVLLTTLLTNLLVLGRLV